MQVRNWFVAIVAVLATASFRAPIHAATIRVPEDCSSIKIAVEMIAADGDTVLVQPGTYREYAITNRKDIVVTGTAPEDSVVVAATVIDGDGFPGTVFSAIAGKLAGVTITGGATGFGSLEGSPVVERCQIVRNVNLPDYVGGGAFIEESATTFVECLFMGNSALQGGAIFSVYASLTFIGCRFVENSAVMWSGGAVFLGDSVAEFVECVFARNTAGVGGGIYAVYSDLVLSGCLFESNTANFGGAVDLGDATLIAEHCVISGNRAAYGAGGFYISNMPARLTNCLLTGNEAASGAALRVYDVNDQRQVLVENCTLADNLGSSAIHTFNGSGLKVTNSVLWGVTPIVVEEGDQPSVTYSDVECGWPGEGNIDADPLFMSKFGFDYLLGVDSPAIDAGDPSILDGISDWHPRWPARYPNGARSDMGAYGGPANRGWLLMR